MNPDHPGDCTTSCRRGAQATKRSPHKPREHTTNTTAAPSKQATTDGYVPAPCHQSSHRLGSVATTARGSAGAHIHTHIRRPAAVTAGCPSTPPATHTPHNYTNEKKPDNGTKSETTHTTKANPRSPTGRPLTSKSQCRWDASSAAAPSSSPCRATARYLTWRASAMPHLANAAGKEVVLA